jgi:hypothetical protein
MDQPLTINEPLDIEADPIADQIRMEARGPRGARPQCNHWELERVSLSIEGVKCTGHIKQKLRSQLHDEDMWDCLRLKEEWTLFTLGCIWDRISMTLKTAGLQSQRHVTIFGTPESNINSTIMKYDHAACAMIKQKICDKYLHAHRYIWRYTELTHGCNCKILSNVGRYQMTSGWLWKKGCSLTLLPQRNQET